MFIGHFALGFAAKKWAPTVSLGTLFLACQFADLLWPMLVLMGFERFEIDPGNTRLTPLNFVHYPYSHSLTALLLWGALLGGLYLGIRRSRVQAALAIAVLVVSHWVLDVLVHRPDMPVTIDGRALLGFGLWNLPPAAIAIELTLFAGGVFVYQRSTVALDRIGNLAFWALVAFLFGVYISTLFGPPPTSATVVGAALAMWILVAWGYWSDRHRQPRDMLLART